MSNGERASAEADIPDLSVQKRDKEKKRSGFLWNWGGGGEGVSLFSLLGGDGDLAAARAWETLSNSLSQLLRGGVGTMAAGRGAATGGLGLFGGHGLLGGVMLGLAGLVFALWGWMHWGRHKGSGSAEYDLGGISSSVHPHGGADSVRLKFAGESANGELQWGKPWNQKDEPKPTAKPEETKGPEETQKPDETDWNEILGHAQEMASPTLKDGALSGAGLSSSLGGRFADKNVFAAFNTANAGNYKAPKMSGPKRAIASATSAIRKFPATARRYAMKGGQRFRSAFSPLAFAQLRLTNALSGQAANTTSAANDDTAKSLASDAFAQGVTAGGTLPGPGTGVSVGGAGMSNPPTVPPMGPGAPDLTQPPDVTPTNMTPYQNSLDQAMQMIQQAAMLKMLGLLLIAIGVALIACGWPVMLAGIALVAMGVYMELMAMKLAAAAKQIGDAIVQAQQGQQTQGNIVSQCADQASNIGTGLPNCQHDQAPDMHTNIRQDVDKERSAEWTWDSENGGGNSNSSTKTK